MKHVLFLFFSMLAVSAYGQDKYNYVSFNDLVEVRGTPYMVARIQNIGKMMTTHSKYLLFINTQTGESTQVDFPKESWFGELHQVKIDSLRINIFLVEATVVNLDNSKRIDWSDPTSLIVISPDGKEKTQLTEDAFYVRTWKASEYTGKLVVTGHYDSNKNGKYDKTDKNAILIYDLKTLKLVSRI